MGQMPRHFGHSINLPPGTIAQGQLAHIPALHGYVQPVEVSAPQGARVAVRQQGGFAASPAGPLRMGLLIGPVYQLKVTNIPFQEGREVYPTIELVNRLYPPEGTKIRFPVPVQLTQEELEMALAGQFITRVIYLEDSASALGVRSDPQNQEYFEALAKDDPLQLADRLGRPMAILRMGSRVPDFEQANSLGFADPPVTIYPYQAGASERGPAGSGAGTGAGADVNSSMNLRGGSDPSAAIERAAGHYPRLPLQPRRYPITFPAGYPQAR